MTPDTGVIAPPDLEAALAAVPERRDFAFSPDLRRAAWINDDVIEWTDDGQPGAVHRVEPGVPLAPGTNLELISPARIGIFRPTDAGVEILAVATGDPAGGPTDRPSDGLPVRRIASLPTPRTCLLPRLAGADWQLLAVTDFAGASVLWRINWSAAEMTEAGRLPAPVDGGVWLEAGRRLALNLVGASGRSSVYSVDLEAGRYSLLFEASAESDDRAVLFHPETGRLVVTSDVFGYPGVGIACPGGGTPLRFLPPLGAGEEAGAPVAFVDGGAAILLRHEEGVSARLRLADVETLEISAPLPVPDGEVGVPVVAAGDTVRFPFSAPDVPWRTARLTLPGGSFRFDGDPDGDAGGHLAFLPARATTFPGPAGPMPALVIPPGDTGSGDLIVVALHGGPIARWGGELQPELQLFARLGLPVVALDYPGSTGSGQPFMRALFGRAGSIDVEAVAGVVDALTASGDRQVILYGESYGAFLALATSAVRHCAGVVAFAPFASFESLRATGSPEVREVLELLDGGNPDDFGRNLVTSRRTNRGKVLIAHGTADRTIPVEHSRALARALRDRDVAGDTDVRLVELADQGHELNGRHVLEQWYREIAGFVASLSASRSPAQREHHQQQGR